MIWTVQFHEAFDEEFRGRIRSATANISGHWLDDARSLIVVKNLDDVIAGLPKERQQRIEVRAMELATLKDLRLAFQQTQEQLAAELGVGQDAISRLEKRSDMLLSTLRHYVEGMGGTLELVARFPNRPPVVIEQIGTTTRTRRRSGQSQRKSEAS